MKVMTKKFYLAVGAYGDGYAVCSSEGPEVTEDAAGAAAADLIQQGYTDVKILEFKMEVPEAVVKPYSVPVISLCSKGKKK